MTDIPIIFSGPMVRALLEGRKTMTRRLLYAERKVKNGRSVSPTFIEAYPPPLGEAGISYFTLSGWQNVRPGDQLWVRETLQKFIGSTSIPSAQYAADITAVPASLWNWRNDKLPSIHMPRWASRLTLTVLATKIERLQDISEQDARDEGMGPQYFGDGDAPFIEPGTQVTSKMQFRNLWNALHGSGSWNANPSVVAPTFRVEFRNIDAMP